MDSHSPFCHLQGSCGVTWHCHIVNEWTLPHRCQRHGTWIPCERNQWWGGAELAHLGWLFVHVSSSVHPYVVVVVRSCVVVVIICQLLVATLPMAAWPLHLM